MNLWERDLKLSMIDLQFLKLPFAFATGVFLLGAL